VHMYQDLTKNIKSDVAFFKHKMYTTLDKRCILIRIKLNAGSCLQQASYRAVECSENNTNTIQNQREPNGLEYVSASCWYVICPKELSTFTTYNFLNGLNIITKKYHSLTAEKLKSLDPRMMWKCYRDINRNYMITSRQASLCIMP